jgi:hypothetical protein
MDDRRPDTPDERLQALFAAEIDAAKRDYLPRLSARSPRRRTAPATSLALLATVAIALGAIVRFAGETRLPASSGNPSTPVAAVTTGTESEVPLPTGAATPSLDWCAAALVGGTLLVHEDWGIALHDGGHLIQVLWPQGYVHRDDAFGRALTGPDGHVVARVGDHVRIGGGYLPDRGRVWGACHIPPVLDIVKAGVPVPNGAPRARGLVCMAAHLGGELVAHDGWGVAVGSGDPIQEVIWPHGFFARDDDRGRALVNDRGRIVGYVGESGGASGGGDPFRACPGTVSFIGGARIDVPTGPPVTADTPCLAAQTAGELVAHEEWNVAMLHGDRVIRVIWPNGYSARDGARGRALIDDEDAIVGYVGDSVFMGGGFSPGGDTWGACPFSIDVSPAGQEGNALVR